MKLLSLCVEHFRCIRKVSVEFAPGLNVLYGPNDLGKSSLAHAIRAALLLQHNVKEHEKFVNWSGSGDPHVELVFESEPQRIWRVRKTFGIGGSSFLDESRNGIDFSSESKGREVDGRLREILRWGIAPPGKGAQKGMPESFLSTALFAEQDRVDAIFEHTLSKDSDEGGKKYLSEVLQAMAEDEVFRHVLTRAQERVDEAFNKTGGRKTGKSAPWPRLREAILLADQRFQQSREELQTTAALEKEHQQLLVRKLQSKDAVERAEAAFGKLEGDLEKQEQRKQTVDRLEGCKAQLAGIAKQLDELAAAEKHQNDLTRRVATLQDAEAASKRAVCEAGERLTAAADALAQLQSEDRVSERLLKKSTLEKRKADLGTERERNQGTLDRIAVIESAAAKVHNIEIEAVSLSKSLADVNDKHEAAVKAVRDLEEQQRELGALGQSFRLKTAMAELDQAQRSLTQVNQWREEARQKHTAAAALENSQPLFSLPDTARINDLRRLESDRRVAAARLDVGLAVTVRPKRGLRLTIQRDGAELEEHDLRDSAFEASARSQIWFEIDGIAEISLAGGADDARHQMDHLERRWQAEAAPLLKLAEAVTLEQLVQIVNDAEQRKREIHNAHQAVAQLEQRIGDQRDWAALITEGKAQVAASEKQLADADRVKLERAAVKSGLADVAAVEKRLEVLRSKHASLIGSRNDLATQLKVDQARQTDLQKSLDSDRDELARAESSIDGNWQDGKGEITGRQVEIANELCAIQTEIDGLEAAVDRGVAEAQKASEDRKQELEAAEEAHRRATGALSKAREERAADEGGLKIRRESAAKLDENAARQAVGQVEAELQSIPAPDPLVTEQHLAEARERVETTCAHLEQIEKEILEKRGALQQVGGDVSRQHAEEAQAQLDAAKHNERETELEFEAWQLLRSTLREAEEEESGHLGRMLAGPIASRISDLTAGRYSKLALGPSLETQGIYVAGDDRDVSLLSVGTKDQLSTLLRLTIAEQLGSTIVLDDQLTQSDASRMLWLRDFLVQIAASIQVVVFTCRAGDYLLDGGGSTAVRSIDLVKVIDRSPASAGL